MPIDWMNGLLGGGLIGLAAAIYLLVNGRIMGASGIIGGLIDGSASNSWAERGALLLGLLAAPAALAASQGSVSTNATANLAVLIIAGLFVGLGTRIANGCTSGHGVCGISRLSLRGIVATVFYIGAGGLTVVVFKHLLGAI